MYRYVYIYIYGCLTSVLCGSFLLFPRRHCPVSSPASSNTMVRHLDRTAMVHLYACGRSMIAGNCPQEKIYAVDTWHTHRGFKYICLYLVKKWRHPNWVISKDENFGLIFWTSCFGNTDAYPRLDLLQLMQGKLIQLDVISLLGQKVVARMNMLGSPLIGL